MPSWWHSKGRYEIPYRLEITDGTTTVDLIHGANGWYLRTWRPSVAGYKDGGTYQSSPLAPGRQLVDKQFDNAVEQMTLDVSASTQNGGILDVQDLMRLLETASNYGAKEAPIAPTYLLAQSTRETNIRYALIVAGRIPELEYPYGQPFVQNDGRNVWEGITLLLERQHWLEQPPGTGTAVEIGASETYQGRTLGNVNSSQVSDPTTAAGEVFVSNKRAEANLTDTYYFNTGLGAWSSNLMDDTPPITFWTPGPHGAGDATYFGIATGFADSGPFSSIVFDITTKAEAGTSYTILWEYYNGAAWVTFTTIQDNTAAAADQPWSNLGVNSVVWAVPSDWATANLFTLFGGTAPNTPGYWVRARMTALTGLFTRPVQGNRLFYSVIWPYVEFVTAQVGGDIPALARWLAACVSTDSDITQILGQAYSDRLVMGLRSTSRGTNFTAYLNASDEQNPSGVTVAIASVANVNTTLVTFTPAPTGRSYLVNAAGAQALLERLVITLDFSIAPDFYGRFHVYGRFEPTTVTAFTAALKVSTLGGAATIQTPTVTVNSLGLAGDVPLVADFGVLSIPPVDIVSASDTTDELEFTIMVSIPDASTDVYIYDLILIPVDEWAGDYVAPNLGATGSASVNRGDTYLDVDSIALPKRNIRAILRKDSSDYITSNWQAISPQAMVNPNATQRMWFLSFGNLTGASALHQTTHTIQLYRANQYLGMRGSR